MRLRIGAVALMATLLGCQAASPPPTDEATWSPSPSAPGHSFTPTPSASPAAIVSPITTHPTAMDARYEAALSLFEYSADEPLELRVVESKENADFIREEITYASPMGGEVPATILRPRDAATPPGLVVMHGSGGTRADLRLQAIAYAELGVMAILIDGPSARRDGEWIRFDARDRDEQVQLILDLRRAVDVLVELGADPSRIGFLGYSYGAAMGGLLAGVEDRIRAYALPVGDGGLVSHFTGPDDGGAPPPGVPPDQFAEWLDLMEPIEPIYFIRHASPARLLLQSARDDALVPESDAEAWHDAASAPKTLLWYDSGHHLPLAAWCDQADWLRAELEFSEEPLLPDC